MSHQLPNLSLTRISAHITGSYFSVPEILPVCGFREGVFYELPEVSIEEKSEIYKALDFYGSLTHSKLFLFN